MFSSLFMVPQEAAPGFFFRIKMKKDARGLHYHGNSKIRLDELRILLSYLVNEL